MFVVPGDVIELRNDPTDEQMEIEEEEITWILGPGLRRIDGKVIAVKSGQLKKAGRNRVFVDSAARRYIPAKGDSVIGLVLDKKGDNFIVDIGAPFNAILPYLSFEGATKRNRPAIKMGVLIYASVVKSLPGVEPEICCFNPQSGRSEGFGELKGGFLVKCDTRFARNLLNRHSDNILSVLGKKMAFEVAVGINGRVWVKSDSPKKTLLLARTIEDVSKGTCDVEGAFKHWNDLFEL